MNHFIKIQIRHTHTHTHKYVALLVVVAFQALSSWISAITCTLCNTSVRWVPAASWWWRRSTFSLWNLLISKADEIGCICFWIQWLPWNLNSVTWSFSTHMSQSNTKWTELIILKNDPSDRSDPRDSTVQSFIAGFLAADIGDIGTIPPSRAVCKQPFPGLWRRKLRSIIGPAPSAGIHWRMPGNCTAVIFSMSKCHVGCHLLFCASCLHYKAQSKIKALKRLVKVVGLDTFFSR